jgi:hypothetical protein
MTSNEIEDLVFDTLYFRRMVPDTCLQTNLAGQELEQLSAIAMPLIENVLSNIVAHAPQPARTRVELATGDLCLEHDPFPGLNGLLGAYLRIGSRHDSIRAVGFLRTLPPALLAKAVALVPVFFRKAKVRPQEKKTNDLKEPPDERLLSFIKESSHAEDRTLRDNAVWAMSFYSPK